MEGSQEKRCCAVQEHIVNRGTTCLSTRQSRSLSPHPSHSPPLHHCHPLHTQRARSRLLRPLVPVAFPVLLPVMHRVDQACVRAALRPPQHRQCCRPVVLAQAAAAGSMAVGPGVAVVSLPILPASASSLSLRELGPSAEIAARRHE